MHGDGNDLKYAQASDVISKGERYWFDQQETAELIAHNRKYQLLSPAEQYFRLCFEVCQDPSEGEYRSAADTFQRTNLGTVYLVKQIH